MEPVLEHFRCIDNRIMVIFSSVRSYYLFTSEQITKISRKKKHDAFHVLTVLVHYCTGT
jgi:hypothetical protein